MLRADCRLKAIHPSNIAAATRSLLMAAGPTANAPTKACSLCCGLEPARTQAAAPYSSSLGAHSGLDAMLHAASTCNSLQ